MLVQQERTKPRPSASDAAGAELEVENRKTGANGTRSNEEGEEKTDSIDFRAGYLRTQLLRKDPGRLGRNASISDYINDHLPKVVIAGLVLLSILILVVVRNRGDAAALLCIESAHKHSETVPYPDVDLKKIRRVVDKGKYGIVKAERWMVVAVSGPPTEEIRALVKLQGWQVVAVGDSGTPGDWDVKGAIFLSVEQQAALGYRILADLPYNSYVRKSVGYLFAIQHGAKKIYDADENASVLGGDLSKVFELKLTGPHSRKKPLLQYTSAHNRTCVNPYIHFGQRSVWPRGLPLELVGEVNPEMYYGQVSSGKQFIQQGLANGLPDVDSIFYHTRKSGIESFDISFDSHAPPVALPQGIMAPLNNFNTLFHSPAFWALMLPISVSPKASDIVRGYWAQRLLWEIGGFVAIHPPSIHRMDHMMPPSFVDEKDLHNHVARLISFLVSWRSKKPTLFEKILHLSHSMAEAGFWTAQDVVYTAAWLQDLVSVGYLQPRLFAVELDRDRPAFPHLDHEEFVPLRLPSVHLGVEEASAVNFEIGNLLRWREFYGNMVLILDCSWPVNRTILGWKMLYGRIFKSVVVVSEQSDLDFGVEAREWWKTYKALPKIFERFPNAEGFLFMKDDVILNYWNLLQANKTKLWNLHKVSKSWKVLHYNKTGSEWYRKSIVKQSIQNMLSNLPVHFKIAYRENVDEHHYVVCNSDIFYVPRRFVGDFIDLVALGVKAKLRQEIAIPLFFLALDSAKNFDTEAFSSIVYKTGESLKPSTLYSAEVQAVRPWKATSELEFLSLLKTMASGDPLLLEVL